MKIQAEGRRQKAEGKRQKAKGKREKAKVKRQKGEGINVGANPRVCPEKKSVEKT